MSSKKWRKPGTALTPEWLEKMIKSRRGYRPANLMEGNGMQENGSATKCSQEGLKYIVSNPGADVSSVTGPVQNYSILDLDLESVAKLRQNFRSVIASHRLWTWAQSERRYKWNRSDFQQSCISPPSGTYLHYIRYRGRLLCLVGEASQSWCRGVIADNCVAEFCDNNNIGNKNGSKEQNHMQYIKTTLRKIAIPGGGNYTNPESVRLGPCHLRKAFDVLYRFMTTDNGRGVLGAMTSFIIHLWDSSRNDQIKDRVLEAFYEMNQEKALYLEDHHITMMRNWEQMSDSATRSIEMYEKFKAKHILPRMTTPWSVHSNIRILHRPRDDTNDTQETFDTEHLPLPLGDGTRDLDSRVQYPPWVLCSYPQDPTHSYETSSEASKSLWAPPKKTSWEVYMERVLKEEEDLIDGVSEKELDLPDKVVTEYKEADLVDVDSEKELDLLDKVVTKDADLSDGVSEELDLPDKAVTKYKDAAAILTEALRLVVSECKPKAKIFDLCEKGDSCIRNQTKVYKRMKTDGGIAFPTSISVNNIVCHFSPLATDEAVLEENDMVKIDMGCHIDGFIAVVAHTYVITSGPVTGRAADVLAAANTAAEVAMRFVRPGKKSKEVTEAIQKVAASYDCKIVESFHCHQLKQYVLDDKKVLPSVSNADTKVDDGQFVENGVYVVDIVTSTGEGKPKSLLETPPTIYKLDENGCLEMKISRSIFSAISQIFPFKPSRELEGMDGQDFVEYLNAGLMKEYPVLHEKQGELVARIKFTVVLIPNGPSRITSNPLQELHPTKFIEDNADIKTWLALGIKSKKKGGGKKKKGKKGDAAEAETMDKRIICATDVEFVAERPEVDASASAATEEKERAQVVKTRLEDAVTSGEEEDVLLHMNAKLYKLHKEGSMWRERCSGAIKLLKQKQTCKVRLVMIEAKTHKICANRPVVSTTKMQEHKGSDSSCVWKTLNSVDGKVEEIFAIRFASVEECKMFKDSVQNIVDSITYTNN